MSKNIRLSALAGIIVLAILALVWAWAPDRRNVDPAIVQTAAEGARAAAAEQPKPAADAPVVKGRARPGSLGGPTP